MKARSKAGVAALAQTLAQNTQRWQNILVQSSPAGKAKKVNKKKFSCDYCKRKFVYQTGLARHVQKFHPGEENSVPGQQTEETEPAYDHPTTFDIVAKCKDCGEIFPDIKHFEAHSVRYNWEHMAVNPSSQASEMGSLLFMEQLMIVVIHTALVCEFCDACFSDYASLFYHEAHHSASSGFACSFCKLACFTLEKVLEHRAHCAEYGFFRANHLLNVGVVYSCNACMAPFCTLPELYEHRYGNHHYFPRNIKELVMQDETYDKLWLCCEICGFMCDHIHKLVDHRNAKHSAASPGGSGEKQAEKPLAIQRATVKRVEKEESNNYRQFLCEKCGKTYTQSSHLWQHLRFHNGVRPFGCTVQGCTRRFTIRPDLNDHIRKCHTGERPYECKVCHKRFLTGSVFYQHRLIHRNERRHACKDCERRFYRADALKNHQRIHTGEKPYACTHCDRKFRQRGDREKHVRSKHMKIR